ncbi:maleylpyruvate isomerase family mycothiol-dependent enzyme [Actinokineospora diospyrosa]|uniref:TIGR03083 family protein n=1 Tax=Actinokineospora diospyrosa TaxID=103728 RepID=A0ABT1IED7_9PSEU|nr:maleylpyruvate isomerase family mycothiol-dependent enzyme [Actinokineospora diospyrosa]MCP2270997.1 TIGR03083 family protein [Actinokineospora diospyrosa]
MIQRLVPNNIAYGHVRETVTALLTENPDLADTPVPACPGWTARDLFAHLVEVCDHAMGQLTGTPRIPPFTAKGMDIPQIAQAWAERAEEADRLLADGGGRLGRVGVMDAFTHELDLRYALGLPLPIDTHPAVPRAFDVVISGLSASITTHDLPALLVRTPTETWIAGEGDPAATLSGDRLTIYRALAGRRAPAAIAELDWTGDPHRWIPAFTWGPFAPATAAPES